MPPKTKSPDRITEAVKSAQTDACTQVVPEALRLRIAAARTAQAEGRPWRTAGAKDADVIRLEAPFRRIPVALDEPDATPDVPADAGQASEPAAGAETTTEEE